MRLDRRSFIAALGGSMSAWAGPGESMVRSSKERTLPLGASLRTGEPLRFIGVFTPHGRADEYFPPKDGFDFGYQHAVLAPFEDDVRFGRKYKDCLSIIDGVDLSAGLLTGTVGHDAPRVILTGSGADGKTSSVDQFLSVEQGLGRDTIYTSLALGVGDEQSGPRSSISYSQGGSPLPKCINPQSLFDSLFGAPVSGKSEQRLAQERAQGKSILDFLASDLKRLSRDAPRSQLPKISQHHEALRDIEKRLTKVAPACDRPARPRDFDQVRSFGGGERFFDEITDLTIDLMVRALACDLTRFATLFLSDLSRTGMNMGLPDDVHQGVAHLYQAKSVNNPGVPASWQALAVQNRYTYSKVARLAMRLDEAQVLGDALTYVSSDMGDPSRHSSRDVPTLLISDAGGHLQTLGYHRLEEGQSIPNNRLLVSICQAFGLEIERFGDSSSSGVLTGRFEPLHTPALATDLHEGVLR